MTLNHGSDAMPIGTMKWSPTNGDAGRPDDGAVGFVASARCPTFRRGSAVTAAGAGSPRASRSTHLGLGEANRASIWLLRQPQALEEQKGCIVLKSAEALMSSDLSMSGCDKSSSLIRLTGLSAGSPAWRRPLPREAWRSAVVQPPGTAAVRSWPYPPGGCVASRRQQGLDENRHDVRYLARDGIREMVAAAFERGDGDSVQPHAQGHCTNRNRPIIGWPAQWWSILVREPGRNCGKPGRFRRIIHLLQDVTDRLRSTNMLGY